MKITLKILHEVPNKSSLQQTTFFAFFKQVISFFDDVSQKILWLLNCLPIGRQQKRQYKSTR